MEWFISQDDCNDSNAKSMSEFRPLRDFRWCHLTKAQAEWFKRDTVSIESADPLVLDKCESSTINNAPL